MCLLVVSLAGWLGGPFAWPVTTHGERDDAQADSLPEAIDWSDESLYQKKGE